MARVFINRVNPGKRSHRIDICHDDGVVINGYARIPDAMEYSQSQLKAIILERYADTNNKGSAATRAGFIFRFLNVMRPGDYVVTPVDKRLHIGRIHGDPYFDPSPNAIATDTAWRRPVTWLTSEDAPIDDTEVSAELRKWARMPGTTYGPIDLAAEIDSLVAGIVSHVDEDGLIELVELYRRVEHGDTRSKRTDTSLDGVVRRHAAALARDAVDGDAFVGEEGAIRYASHRFRERDRRAVEAKKSSALAEHGRLACEVCEFEFRSTWGELGTGYIEAHHLRHLADGGPRRTAPKDLALVCANCHRMFHRLPSGTTVQQLRRHLNQAS